MPTYEYQCKSCKLSLEEVQKISDKPLVKCPQCNKKSLERVISATGFVLKGSGWFRNS